MSEMGDHIDREATLAPGARGDCRIDLRRSKVARTVAAAFVLALVVVVPSGAATARVARTFTLSDNGRLHLTSHHSFTLNEQGTATGTIAGAIYIHLHVVSTNRVTAQVNIYPKGGSLTGYAGASYHPSGSLATFNGTMSIAGGTGRYSRARGSGLSFTGTIQRSNDSVTVHVSGRMSA
jgi:hypothetical protein